MMIRIPEKAIPIGLALAFSGFAAAQDGTRPPMRQPELEAIRALRPRLLASAKADTEAGPRPYPEKTPHSDHSFDLLPIPGGEFLMGSPPTDPHRQADEGPPVRVRVKPFWMGRHEVTWESYDVFIDAVTRWDGTVVGQKKRRDDIYPADVLILSGPSEENAVYLHALEMDKPGRPAVGMTQHAAAKYCQWLSFYSGRFYRLPTEAEWEYACRAGTTTAYHFGDDSDRLGEYAVFDPTQIRTGYAKVGTKKPNPWGLHDMHGNVLEWCLDQYSPTTYARWKEAGEPVDTPFLPAVTEYPRVARGGSWYDTADLCRAASRTASHPDWKIQDPKQPKSAWWFTDATWLGFRVVRPAEVPSAEDLYFLWNSEVADKQEPLRQADRPPDSRRAPAPEKKFVSAPRD